MQKAAANPTAQNLNTLPELLLLGVVFLSGKMGFGGSIGISGAVVAKTTTISLKKRQRI
nr:hypothetical protein [Riemerella anatipestifer]